MNRTDYLKQFEPDVLRHMEDMETIYNYMETGKRYRCKDIRNATDVGANQYVAGILKRMWILNYVKREEVKTGKIIELTTEKDWVRNPETGWYEEVTVQREKPLRIEETIAYFEKI